MKANAVIALTLSFSSLLNSVALRNTAIENVVLNSDVFLNFMDAAAAANSSCDDSAISIVQFINSEIETFKFGKERNPVIILGLTGTGKSTLGLLLTGAKLTGVETFPRSRKYRLVDENDLISGNTTTESKTLIPGLMTDDVDGKLYPFYDCPGFSDTRSVKHDILAMYSIYELLNNVDAAKFLITASYTTVETFLGDRTSFRQLSEHIIFLLKDVNKYRHAILFIVTKVPNEMTHDDDGNPVLYTDATIIASIAEFLKQAKDVIIKNNKDVRIADKIRQLNNQKIDFIDILLQQDEDNNYVKIGILRLAMSAGPIEKMKLLQKEKAFIRSIIYNETTFVSTVDNGDFGVTISTASGNCMRDLMDEMHNYLVADISKIDNEILQFYQKLEEGNFDLEFVYNKILLGYRNIQPLEFKKNHFYESLKEVIDAVTILGIDIQVSLNSIQKSLQIIRFFETVSDFKSRDILNIESKLTKSISYLIDSKDWYAFLISLHDTLSKYDNYIKAKEFDLTAEIAKCSNKQNFGKIFNKIGLEKFMSRIDKMTYQQVSHIKVDSFKLRALKMVLEKTLTTDIEKSCSSNKLTAKGYNVRLKDVMSIRCLEKIKFIEVFALNTIFIDKDVDKTGKNVQLSIIAPTWEIYGRRKIILDGEGGKQRPSSKAANGERPFLNGKNGATGLPGGSSGHFLGIGNTFINIQALDISANGGRGGIGQHGGNAVDSKQGEDPDVYGRKLGLFSPPYSYVTGPDAAGTDKTPFLRSVGKLEAYWTKKEFKYSCLRCNNAFSFYDCYCDYRVSGLKGESGGDGGDGGIGGAGGNAGTVVLIGLNETPDFQYFNETGDRGPDGKGGDGSRVNRDGDTVLVSYANEGYYKFYVNERKKSEGTGIHCVLKITKQSVYKGGDKIEGGKNGIDGKSDMNAVKPEINPFTKPSQTINDYKNYLRENLSKSIKKLDLEGFVANFDKNVKISSLYDTLGLVNELQTIEYQYQQLRNDISFIPYLKSLSQRIVEYSKSGNIKLEDKKVLNFLYTATASKICAIKNNLYHNPVINLLEYMEIMIENIGKMRDNKKQLDIAEHRGRYKREADEKIEAAIGFIENQIKPEINTLFTNIEKEFVKLLKEVLDKKSKTKEELKKEEKKRKELEKMLVFKQILSQIKIVSFGLQFLGPTGKAVNTVVSTVTDTVESLALEKSEDRGGKLNHLSEETIKMAKQLKTIYDERDQLFKKYLDDMKKEVEAKNKDDPDWKDIKKDIEAAKPDDNKEKAGLRDGQKKRKTLLDSLKSKITDWAVNKGKEDKEKDKKDDEKVDFVVRWKTVLEVADFFKDINEKARGDIEKVKEANDIVAAVEEKLKLLEKYEESIYDTMVPLVEQMESDLTDTVNKFNGKTHVELDVGKWRVKDSLQDIKEKMRQLTNGYNIEESLQRVLNRLESAIEIVIDVYDRIDLYSDNKRLGDYIADIGSAGSLEITVQNEELQAAIRQLEQIIRTNVLLEQFELITNEVKAHQFPFGQFYLAESESLLKLNDTESSINKAIQTTENWKKKLKLSIITIDKFDKEIFSEIWFGSNTGSAPFYSWKNSEIKNPLAKLLEGEAITIKADVTKVQNLNALKYNEIGINFKALSEETQKKLNSRLLNYDVRLEMEGYQYYRCADKFFYMPVSDNIVIEYSFKRNEFGTGPHTENEVYKKIKKSFFLSPYGLWRIQLLTKTVDQDFLPLKEFKTHLIDLELEGRGWYFKNPSSFSADICTNELSKFYDLDKTISGTNTFDLN